MPEEDIVATAAAEVVRQERAAVTVDPGSLLGKAISSLFGALEDPEPTPRTQADDLAYLAARSFPRWQAAVAPPWPDPDQLYRCTTEALDLAQGLAGYGETPAGNHAWDALTAAGNTLTVYALAAQVAHGCRERQVPTSLDSGCFPSLARACREALRTAQAAVYSLKSTLEDLCE